MEGDGSSTAFLHQLCKFNAVYAVFVPAKTEFHRYRDIDSFYSRFDYLSRKLGILHKCGTAAVSSYLRYGTAHVYVDDIGLIGHEPPCRLCNELGFISEKLESHRTFCGCYGAKLLGLAVAVTKSLCGDHLGYDIGSAVFLAYRPVCTVGD